MYRLSCKISIVAALDSIKLVSLTKNAVQVIVDELRDAAFSRIGSTLTECNILKEISCSLVRIKPLHTQDESGDD